MSVRQSTITMLKTLQKTYKWRAGLYEEDSLDWKRGSKMGLANYYKGRAKECEVMIREIDEIIQSLQIK